MPQSGMNNSQMSLEIDPLCLDRNIVRLARAKLEYKLDIVDLWLHNNEQRRYRGEGPSG